MPEPADDGGGNQSSGEPDLQLSLFPSEREQIEILTEAESEQSPSAFSMAIPQDIVDSLLRIGGNAADARVRILSEFSKDKSTQDKADFLSHLFTGGTGLRTDAGEYAAWCAEDGIHMAPGTSARYVRISQILPWSAAAERITELLEDGTFASSAEIEAAPLQECKRLAQSIWYLQSDLTESAREQGYLSIPKACCGSFPEETEHLAQMLADPAERNRIVEALSVFCDAIESGRRLLRFRFHKPLDLLREVRELSLPRTNFVSRHNELREPPQFITEDEIDGTLSAGSGVSGGKERILSYFSGHTLKEKADFLKEEYGIGGRSHAVSSSDNSCEDHDSKGIRLKKGACPEVQLSWTLVAKRITELIRSRRYLSAEELAELQQRQEAQKLADREEDLFSRENTSVSSDQVNADVLTLFTEDNALFSVEKRRKVSALIAEGASNTEIAEVLREALSGRQETMTNSYGTELFCAASGDTLTVELHDCGSGVYELTWSEAAAIFRGTAAEKAIACKTEKPSILAQLKAVSAPAYHKSKSGIEEER